MTHSPFTSSNIICPARSRLGSLKAPFPPGFDSVSTQSAQLCVAPNTTIRLCAPVVPVRLCVGLVLDFSSRHNARSRPQGLPFFLRAPTSGETRVSFLLSSYFLMTSSCFFRIAMSAAKVTSEALVRNPEILLERKGDPSTRKSFVTQSCMRHI